MQSFYISKSAGELHLNICFLLGCAYDLLVLANFYFT